MTKFSDMVMAGFVILEKQVLSKALCDKWQACMLYRRGKVTLVYSTSMRSEVSSFGRREQVIYCIRIEHGNKSAQV